MHRFWTLIGVTLLALLPHLALGQDLADENVLSIKSATLTPALAPLEAQRTLKFELDLKPGFKAYVDKFNLTILEPYPVGHTALELSPIHEFYDKFSKSTKKGIKGTGLLKTTLEIEQPLAGGPQKMVLELRYQACSETVCYFPQTLKTTIDFEVAGAKAEAAMGAQPMNLLEENFTSAQKRGTAYLFIFVFLAGILTSLTPCLLPMLPLTVAVIGKGHSHDAKLKKFINSLLYVLGIATTYSVLGVVAASSGALFGNILSNVWVQVGFGTAFVLMGLAQFGFFEFQTPLWLQNRFHKMGHDAGGIYITGLISGLIASPCVGPVLVGILTFIAQTQNLWLGFGLMFTYALGLGQLLIVLGVFTGLLYHFPRKPWLMKASKIVLGFALIASGLFYLSLLWPKVNGIHKGPVAEASPASHRLPWQRYSETALAQAKAEGKPVLIDFYADWCLACKELEEKTFSDPEVGKALTDFVLLRFDATEETEALAQLRLQYKIVGLPTILFYSPTGVWLETRTLNEFEAPDRFLERLRNIK